MTKITKKRPSKKSQKGGGVGNDKTSKKAQKSTRPGNSGNAIDSDKKISKHSTEATDKDKNDREPGAVGSDSEDSVSRSNSSISGFLRTPPHNPSNNDDTKPDQDGTSAKSISESDVGEKPNLERTNQCVSTPNEATADLTTPVNLQSKGMNYIIFFQVFTNRNFFP